MEWEWCMVWLEANVGRLNSRSHKGKSVSLVYSHIIYYIKQGQKWSGTRELKGQYSLSGEMKRKNKTKQLSNQDLETELLRETKEKLEGAEDLPREWPLAEQESVQGPCSRPGRPPHAGEPILKQARARTQASGPDSSSGKSSRTKGTDSTARSSNIPTEELCRPRSPSHHQPFFGHRDNLSHLTNKWNVKALMRPRKKSAVVFST